MTATAYIQTHDGYFWQWEDGGQVAALNVAGTNATIAWRAYIAEVLTVLAPQGIPPLGTVLAAIVATNPNGATQIELIAKGLSTLARQNRDEDILADACKFLGLLAQLPDDIKAGNNRKLLFQSIFYRLHKLLSLDDSASVMRYLSKTETVHVTPAPIYMAPNLVRVEFRSLALLGAKIKTLDELLKHLAPVNWLEPESIDLPEISKTTETNEDLISQLATNPKTQKIGSLIPLLWAGLQVPVHATHAGGMPLGGIADITNKGDLDRLLVSEFANDEWLMLLRLAGNEAMYWRREVPPSNSDRQRVILLDTSLRMWGTPRLVAMALAVSLTHHPRSQFEYQTYSVGSSFRSLPLNTIGHLMGALQELDASLTATAGIEEWFKQNTIKNGLEVMLLTAAPSLRQAEFINTLARHSAITTLLTVGSEGEVDYFLLTKSGRSQQQHLALPLHTLWQQKAKNETVKPLTNQEIPLRFANAPTDKKIFVTEDGGIFQITRGLVFYHPGFRTMHLSGWILMASGIPQNNCHYSVGTLPDGDFVLLVFDRNDNTIQLRNLNTKHSQTVKFPHWQPTDYPSFIFVKDAFFHKNYSGSWQIYPSGQISVVPALQLSLFTDVAIKIKETEKKLPAKHTVLRNIHSIYINTSGNLVANVHELIVKRNAHIKFEKATNEEQAVTATVDEQSIFTFPDGSTVENHISGVLILRSSNEKIPAIYIPSIVATSICMSTQDTFTGNQYYKHSINGHEMPMVSVDQFFSVYFTPFIKHILLSSNGTK